MSQDSNHVLEEILAANRNNIDTFTLLKRLCGVVVQMQERIDHLESQISKMPSSTPKRTWGLDANGNPIPFWSSEQGWG
jgi:hypothetical protein